MKRIIIDSTLCDGCGECQKACENHFKNGESRVLLKIDYKERFVPLICRQCPQPTCMRGCMSGAISKNPDTGHLKYDRNSCGSCFMCVMNCPYGIPFPTQDGYVARCDFCGDQESIPKCVAACSRKAIYQEE